MVDQMPRKPKRVMRWVLAGSLGLNLLFVGAFAGSTFRGGGKNSDGERSAPRGYAAPYVHALPREKRQALFRELRQERSGEARDSGRARRAQYQEMVAVLRQVPFDPVAAERILGTQRDAVTNMQSTAQELWLKEVTEMAPEARATYADTLEKVLKRRPGKRRPRPKDDG
jgi:uncharacterized membrane protein